MASTSERTNNFDLLRLLAALQVVHSHAVEHLHIGYGGIGRALTELASLFPGVPIFFVISGFLISRAFERSSDLTTYARNRILRIYPALWVCLSVSLVLLAAFGVLSRGLLARPVFWAWIAGQLTVVQFFNPGMFREFGVGVLNGSLWTIPVELQFYLAVPFIYRCCVKGRSLLAGNVQTGALATLSVVVWCWWSGVDARTMATKLVQVTLAPHLFMFLVGMLVQRNWNSIASVFEGKAALWTVAYLAFQLARHTWAPAMHRSPVMTAADVIAIALLALTVVSLAYTRRSLSRWVLRGHDVSYGVYLYHMLVVNACVQMGFLGNPHVLVGVITLTIAVATASWLIVERPLLQAKHRSSRIHSYASGYPAFSS